MAALAGGGVEVSGGRSRTGRSWWSVGEEALQERVRREGGYTEGGGGETEGSIGPLTLVTQNTSTRRRRK
jgi:hypothetical protein